VSDGDNRETVERDVIRAALTHVNELNEDDKLPGAIRGMIESASEAARKGISGEKSAGAIVVIIGDEGSHHVELCGGFNPVVAYGAMVDAILEVFVTVQEQRANKVIKSFVGDVETAAAQIEKSISNPTDH